MLLHHFGIVSTKRKDCRDKAAWRKADYNEVKALLQQSVALHDDLLQYISDSLRWIRCFNPCLQTEHSGLNLYDVTVIENSGASNAAQVFTAWASLFALSPSELRLTGSFVTNGESKDYEELRFNRDEVVSGLQRLADACATVSNNENQYLLHLGI